MQRRSWIMIVTHSLTQHGTCELPHTHPHHKQVVRCQVMGIFPLVYIRLGMFVILCIKWRGVYTGSNGWPYSLVTHSICRLENRHFNKSSPTRLQFDYFG